MLERLNAQAHASARANSDDFVLSSLLTFSKLNLLVAELVAVEAWRESVLPALLVQLPSASAGALTLQLYFALYHEATLVNLLEVALYHGYAVEVSLSAAESPTHPCRLTLPPQLSPRWRVHSLPCRPSMTL